MSFAIAMRQASRYSIGGMPVEDVAWAHDLYETAVAEVIGQSLNLWDSPLLK